MKKIIRIFACLVVILPLVFITQSFNKPISPPAPTATVISVTDADCLDGALMMIWRGYPVYDWVYVPNPDRQIKVVFTGYRYSDNVQVTDPGSPFVTTSYSLSAHVVALTNWYNQNGTAHIYSRSSDSESWSYQGDMVMSSSNCTMDGSKVMSFTIDCDLLWNP